jgi:peptidoglycan hydrolase-like protein with peptidoglycan-binding domain
VVDGLTWPKLVFTVRYPNSGNGPRAVQRQLVKYGYRLPITGYFGTETDGAVRDFQRKNGLTIDGVVAQATWRALTGGRA